MASKEKKQDGGELGDAPNDKWKKFFDQFEEIETLESTKWKPVHIMAYFCKKYKQHFNVDYKFKFNNPSPVKSFEIFQIKKLGMLLSRSPSVLRDYIDWAFREKVEKGKKRVTSISFMTYEDMINNYKINVLLANKGSLHVDRSTNLPDDYKNLLKVIGPVNTYGDLAFLNQSFKADAFDSETTANFNQVMDKIIALGFDLTILDRIK